jgi:nucleoside-diphosphate-sugar epimerase
MHLRTEEELEELLSRPSEADIAAMARLDGDLLILGVGGKMGPSLARRAARAVSAAGSRARVIGVARFSSPGLAAQLSGWGVEPIECDLLAPGALAKLPDAPNVIFMAGRKFGSTGNESLTWAMNAYLPGLVADRFKASRIVAFSTGNVYPLAKLAHGGPSESSATAPVGEYAQSALARERMFTYFSGLHGTPGVLLRLNYAIDLRYGVLLDIGQKVYAKRPVDVRMSVVNVIWQGDANSACLRSLQHCQSPPLVLNLTGPETVSVRYIASRFAGRFGVETAFEGEEADTALLSNAAKAHRLFGYPAITLDEMIEGVANWIAAGGPTLAKPTHFETRDGKF